MRWTTDELNQRFTSLAAQGGVDPLHEVEQLLLMLHGDEEAKAFMARFRQRLSVLLALAVSQGMLRSPLPEAALANLLLACCEGLMLQALVHGTLAELTTRTREALPLLLPRVGC